MAEDAPRWPLTLFPPSLPTAMPRGQKSKRRTQEKRQILRAEFQREAEAIVAADEYYYPVSTVICSSAQPPSSQPGTSAGYERPPGYPDFSPKDPVTQKADILMHFLLHKYKLKEPITKAEMLKFIGNSFRSHFAEVLHRTSERMELVFGLDLKEIDSTNHTYLLISKLDLVNENNINNDGSDFPKSGLLMPLLGVIFMSGNRVSEEDMWEFLSMLGIYDGRKHFIFGEPRKLITKDLVDEEYLEYRQVPGKVPPSYEFLWGPRARDEVSKMQVLEFMAKVNGTPPSTFSSCYEEALRAEEERVQARATAKIAASAHARARGQARSENNPR
ncbi:melanoma-associated antigen B17 [Sorex araneus]|uniref:melanoma-associated antigen B17 n=1 Tax=Sorex araneus TaxID=42254 RepID=UPI00033144F9|nr:melanoma-associated antigen B17 [Sorex araneus]